MSVHRRDLLKKTAALTAAFALPNLAVAQTAFNPIPGAWCTFQVVTRLELKPEGMVQAWVPLPSVNEADWFRSLKNDWKTNAKLAEVKRDPRYGAQFLHVAWDDAVENSPTVEITSRIQTRERAVNLAAAGSAPPLSPADRALNLAPTALIPTDGIVRDTALEITAGARTDLDKARAIYEWIVENTFRDARVRGCGVGDIVSMLKTGNLGGKCADLNALFVGLARASGLPARDVYGLRVAASKFGYRSLGVGTDNVTRAQHCRAEVHITGVGWVPVDPADVRKVVLEEPPGNLAINEPRVVAARKALFGAWEGNWLAYNFAHDIVLPGAKGPQLEFLMYPQAETSAGRLDCLDPETFKYTIRAAETVA
jgi:transglutaminase-like putative cysteine protease